MNVIEKLGKDLKEGDVFYHHDKWLEVQNIVRVSNQSMDVKTDDRLSRIFYFTSTFLVRVSSPINVEEEFEKWYKSIHPTYAGVTDKKINKKAFLAGSSLSGGKTVPELSDEEIHEMAQLDPYYCILEKNNYSSFDSGMDYEEYVENQERNQHSFKRGMDSYRNWLRTHGLNK